MLALIALLGNLDLIVWFQIVRFRALRGKNQRDHLRNMLRQVASARVLSGYNLRNRMGERSGKKAFDQTMLCKAMVGEYRVARM
jgi:hypothetical protein